MAELKSFWSTAIRPQVKSLLLSEITKTETTINGLTQQLTIKPNPSNTIGGTDAPKRYNVELVNYAFDQSDKFVKLFVTVDNVQNWGTDNVTVEFTDRSVNLLAKGDDNKDYKLQINNLLETIDVEKSYRKINQNMVTIYAKKVKEGTKWTCLTSIEKRLKDIQAENMAPVEEDDDIDPKDPSSRLQSIMKKMYQSGDSEMKRMISKAWVEGEEKKLKDGSKGFEM